MQTRSIVLVDANVIIECHRTGAWNALSGGYRVQTTEVCVSETQTGYQNRNFEQHIDPEQLRQSLDAVQTVSNRDYVLLEMSRADLPELDDGERSLWAHALTRTDSHWLFCGLMCARRIPLPRDSTLPLSCPSPGRAKHGSNR